VHSLAWARSVQHATLYRLQTVLWLCLQGVKVWEWVTHSLGLPMYTETFKSNAITVSSCSHQQSCCAIFDIQQ
jgi:hypothetical protein